MIEDRKPAAAILSGGMDSTALVYLMKESHDLQLVISFDYGQRHKKELSYARLTAANLRLRHIIVPLDIGQYLQGNSLTDPKEDVPEGHYAEDSMKMTVVPNRNAMFLSVAFAIALGQGIEVVGAGVHAGDHFVYPDCRPAFVESFRNMIQMAVDGFSRPELFTPFLSLPKDEIVRQGQSYAVPWMNTWSCYKGEESHCGKCGTCVERKEAFELAGVEDPTEYTI